jgi:pimeloyl-ACP methyl ester carboxylesterase
MERPSVLFIPGMMLDARMYASQIDALAGDHRSTVADLSRSSSIEAMARDALTTAPERFALVGLSLGGIVAFEVYRQARERVTHLAILDSTPHADRPERSAARLEQMAAVERGDLAQVLQTSMKPLYLARRNRGNQPLLGAILQMGLALGPEVFRNQSLALNHRRDSLDLLRSIGCPTLVLCGREDQLCPVDVHVDMANAMPRADLVVLAETGHLASMEDPQGVTAALRHLLGRS